MSARPSECCGMCPPIMGGGYDCTCAGNPRCPNYTPKRIQRKRTKGWRMPEGAIYVGRPSKWGNPFRVIETTPGRWSVIDENDVDYTEPPGGYAEKQRAMWKATGLYHSELVQWSDKHMMLPELRGRDLACWCPLDQPCHADVLLKFANP